MNKLEYDITPQTWARAKLSRGKTPQREPVPHSPQESLARINCRLSWSAAFKQMNSVEMAWLPKKQKPNTSKQTKKNHNNTTHK